MKERALTITVKPPRKYVMRLSPSNRVFQGLTTERYGDLWERVVFAADTIASGLEQIIRRGYLTKFEKRSTIYPDALYMSELPPVKHRDMIVYKRVLVIEGGADDEEAK